MSHLTDTWQRALIHIGHAGAGAYAPPNTLKSIRLALEMGVDMVEFDIRPCRDALVLYHDDHLPQATNGHALVSECCYDELCRIDVGAGERIPLASDAIDLIRGRALMNVDLKDGGYEAEVVALLNDKRVTNDLIISTLIPESLRLVKQIAPQIRASISYPTDSFNSSRQSFMKPAVQAALRLQRWLLPFRIGGIMRRAQADATTLHYKVISPAVLRRVHTQGGKVYAWTVDDIDPMRTLRAMGVDGITSNRPDLFRQLENG